MKCAIPGMYGRKVPIQSSIIKEEYIAKNPVDAFNDFQKAIDNASESLHELTNFLSKDSPYIYLDRGSGKTQLCNSMFDEYIKELRKKDFEEKSQK